MRKAQPSGVVQTNLTSRPLRSEKLSLVGEKTFESENGCEQEHSQSGQKYEQVASSQSTEKW